MEEYHHGKYIVTGPKPDLVKPEWGGSLDLERTTPMMYLDNEVIKGAFYLESVWLWPTDKEDKGSPEPHTHDFPEALVFAGTNFDDPTDLGGVVEFYIDGERNVMDRSFLAYVPAGVVHCPLNILEITRPIFHIATNCGRMYSDSGRAVE
jgi:hypothetical protein